MSAISETLQSLSAQARLEEIPIVDVSSRVVHQLSHEAPPHIWPMALFASGASVTALVVLALSLPMIEIVADPWSAFFLTAAHVLP